jgi:L-rhamnose-H+ transport protein
MVTPNPILGVSFHSIGAMFAANCYAPQKYIKGWSWETFWVSQAVWCWFLWPIIGAFLTIPNLIGVLSDAPKGPMLFSFLLGLLYGIGGMAFNVSIRYIGFSLTYAISIGLSSVLGTLVPPIVRGEMGILLSKSGSGYIILGVVIGAIGIAFCGMAGRFKEKDLEEKSGGKGEFSLSKGLLLSLLAGVFSAFYGFALEVAVPVVKIAEQNGAGYWRGNVAYLFANTGAFVTSIIYTIYLFRKNKSAGEFRKLPDGRSKTNLIKNYIFALIIGTFWYGQFFFYNLGHVRMGSYEFSSWAVHMIMLVLFSNLIAILYLEWKGCRMRTFISVGISLIVLVASVLILTYGNYIGGLG